jgi:hypothetical protein
LDRQARASRDPSNRSFAILSKEDALTFPQAISQAQLDYFSSLAGAKSIVNDWAGVATSSDKTVVASPMPV